MDNVFTIRAVARMTGLSQNVIRTWERRYGVVTPVRTATNRRRYSSRDVEKLRLVKAAIEAGNSIGAVANLSVEALRRMVQPVPVAGGPLHPLQAESDPTLVVRQCLESSCDLDAAALDRILTQAAVELGPGRFAAEVAAPLLDAVGEAWRADELHPAQEHLVSEVVRSQLARLLTANQPEGDAPVAVAATLRGHYHDLGALMAALMAAVSGWATRFLGSSLPAEEIAWAARSSAAQAVLISLVYPPDDPRVPRELTELRRILGKGYPIAVGGRAAPAYATAISESSITHCQDLASLKTFLDRIRQNA